MDIIYLPLLAGLAGIYRDHAWVALLCGHMSAQKRRAISVRTLIRFQTRDITEQEIAAVMSVASQTEAYFNRPIKAARRVITFDDVPHLVAFAKGQVADPFLAAVYIYTLGAATASNLVAEAAEHECEDDIHRQLDELAGITADEVVEHGRKLCEMLAPRSADDWETALAVSPPEIWPLVSTAARLQNLLL